ncbi:prepilin peptidase [Pseudomonas sp. S1(2024)]|uniref:prepilin peptidase n=1 Tax=Pseudomonas sp. S1(2024) TaxID=3390191 RepID=UPI003978EA9F
MSSLLDAACMLLAGALAGGVLNVLACILPRRIKESALTEAKEVLHLSANQDDVNREPCISIWRVFRGNPFTIAICASIAFGICLSQGLSLWSVACIIFGWVAVLVSKIDHKHGLIPDEITLPLIWVGLMLGYFEVITDIESALWGAIAGYLSLWILYKAHLKITGVEGMGHGDFKLLALMGSWGGWQILPLTIFYASLLLFAVMLLYLSTISPKDFDARGGVALGPYLAIGGWVSLLQGGGI